MEGRNGEKRLGEEQGWGGWEEEEGKNGQSVFERIFSLGRHGSVYHLALNEYIDGNGEQVTHKVLSFLFLKI